MQNVVRLPIKDIPIANVKKPVLNLFDKETMWFIMKTCNCT